MFINTRSLLFSSLALYGRSGLDVVLLGGRQTNGPDNRQGNCKSWMFSILRPMAGEHFVRLRRKQSICFWQSMLIAKLKCGCVIEWKRIWQICMRQNMIYPLYQWLRRMIRVREGRGRRQKQSPKNKEEEEVGRWGMHSASWSTNYFL